MIKRLIALILIMGAVSAWGAAQKLYEQPTATVFRDDSRMYLYQNHSSYNLTGAGLKSVIHQTAWPEGVTKIFQAASSSTVPVQTVNAVRDRRGVIRRLQYESGSWFQGVPGYNHTYIYPFNGMTNVSRTTPVVVGSYWLTRGVIGKGITIQGGPAISPKALKYMGKISGLPNFDFVEYNRVDQSALDAWFWGVSSVSTLAANTTYTIRSDMPAAWGGINGQYSAGLNPCTYAMQNTSSAKVMTNYSTVLCRSTFRTGN